MLCKADVAAKEETKARKKQRMLVKTQAEANKNKEGHVVPGEPGS